MTVKLTITNPQDYKVGRTAYKIGRVGLFLENFLIDERR